MTKIAIWCRHDGDNIIGIGPNIPWHISSDFKRFRRITDIYHLTLNAFAGLPKAKISSADRQRMKVFPTGHCRIARFMC